GGRRRPVLDLHPAPVREGRGAPPDPGERVPVQGRPDCAERDDEAADVRRRARHAGAALLQPALHGLWGRPEAVPRRRQQGLPSRGPRGGLRPRIPAGVACVRPPDRPAYRPQADAGAAQTLAASDRRAEAGHDTGPTGEALTAGLARNNRLYDPGRDAMAQTAALAKDRKQENKKEDSWRG